jgi:hypothetical protein
VTDPGAERQIPVYGYVSARAAGDEKAEWQDGADTPGVLKSRPGEIYKFTFHAIPDVRDEDFVRLVDALAGLPAVRALDLAGCEISDRAFKKITTLPWLESLKFYRMTDRGLAAVAGLPDLRQLALDGSEVTDAGLSRLSGLTRLKDLSLHACPVTDNGVKHLSNLAALEALTLTGCRAITDRGVAVLASMPNLHSIGLEGCWRITDRGVGALAGMPSLTYLSLCRGSGFLTRTLRRLGLSQNSEVGLFSPAAVEQLTAAHPDCNLWQPVDWAAVSG